MYGIVRGLGEYRVNYNSLVPGGLSPPIMKNSGRDGAIIIRHREYVGEIAGTVAFNRTDYDINPGVFSTFPWLGQIAGAYEQYRWRGLIFEYKSTCADALISGSTNASMGTVIMATDYNSPDGNQFIDKLSMENAEYSSSCKPSQSMFHPIECKSSLNPQSKFWIRNGAIGNNQDLRLYDLGTFSIATQSFQAATPSAGELWCTYEIEFYKTKFSYSEAMDNAFDRFLLGGTGSAISNTVPFGTGYNAAGAGAVALVNTAASNIEGGINTAGTTYTLPSKGWIVGDKFKWTYKLYTGGATETGASFINTGVWTVTLGAGLAAFNAGVDMTTGLLNGASVNYTVNINTTTGKASGFIVEGYFQVASVATGAVYTVLLASSVALPSTGASTFGTFEVLKLPYEYAVA